MSSIHKSDAPTDYRIMSSCFQTLGSFRPAYSTTHGSAYIGDSRELLAALPDDSINLVMTSPPFALLRKKAYGNESQEDYIDWLMTFAQLVFQKLRADGSFVLDLGGAYEKGVPARSLYNFRVLIRLVDQVGFTLAEDFYWFNPSKLPSPIEWVNKRKLRAKDAVNTVWWLSKTAWPKANVANVLTEYSPRMQKLLEDPSGFYSAAKRPSGHDISEGFGKNNGGAIPSNLLQIPNSESNGVYVSACKTVGADRHPARFPQKLPEFFIRMLTDRGDMVVDIFAGSNTTGMVAEAEHRHWLSFEQRADYVAASAFRFVRKGLTDKQLESLYSEISNGNYVDMSEWELPSLFAKRKSTTRDGTVSQ